jgi:V8-like Glu-specific endopeptidase
MLAGMIFMPFASMAADHCTHPTKFKVDKRCYVTDEQKKVAPYNAVVALVDDYGMVYCTGTIVKVNGKPYLYTAKHCSEDENYVVQSKLKIKLQNGRILDVTKHGVGNYDDKHNKNFYGDWAIYSIANSDVPLVKTVEMTGKREIGFNPIEPYYDATVVGYGGAKIMSDIEIFDLKTKYIAYLIKEKKYGSNTDESVYGYDNGGIDTNNEYVQNFLEKNWKYWLKLVADVLKLKLSHCTYSGTGRMIGCQYWDGNSGGPIFDNDGKIMGIATRGNSIIGGSRHAGSEDWWDASDISSVELLK